MTDLGPTGRTKHTDSFESLMDGAVIRRQAEDARRQQQRIKQTALLLKYSLVIFVTGLLGWIAVSAVINLVQAPERERRVEACVVAMTRQEDGHGPIPQCDGLSASEKRSAAYEYARREGLL